MNRTDPGLLFNYRNQAIAGLVGGAPRADAFAKEQVAIRGEASLTPDFAGYLAEVLFRHNFEQTITTIIVLKYKS